MYNIQTVRSYINRGLRNYVETIYCSPLTKSSVHNAIPTQWSQLHASVHIGVHNYPDSCSAFPKYLLLPSFLLLRAFSRNRSERGMLESLNIRSPNISPVYCKYVRIRRCRYKRVHTRINVQS
jgi:hypothetical protein